MKNIVLCADDYGQAPAISAGILALIKQRRLSAVSCMVNTSYWSEHAKWLLPYPSQIDIGLHLNLTEGMALSNTYKAVYGEKFFSLPILLSKSFLRKLDLNVVIAECEVQIDRFVATLGFLPHFIDGHHHVHQFPVIRDALVAVYQTHLCKQKPYVRWVNEKIYNVALINNFKKLFIRATGTNALKRLLLQYQIPHNQSFAGIYAFSKSGIYRKLFQSFIKNLPDRGLIMCHPGLFSAGESTFTKARYDEYLYFKSEHFLKDCERYQIQLGTGISGPHSPV